MKKEEELLTAVKQEVIVELSQRVPHSFRHWTLLILWPMLKVGQQKNLEEERQLHQHILSVLLRLVLHSTFY